ncbi:sigma-70 family RNA polymerase sigma factor [Mesonia sp. K7]|uniref:sigma-70 family RNA polymerase sigma factor n=1 Tax=Mesonia sp. K7 TaxID=2218606 RepID=UPI000DA90ED8|nr:sigma-70 family RNA polymerase sigma factor [Mesonia sp. K7]PZD76499.1 RNA polymerase subunit sigma-70 [Mesonia sp. K7]
MNQYKENEINPDLWIERYSDFLFNYTIVRVNDRDIAKDLISETFLAALKAKKNFKGEASERTWLISILKRKIIDYYRKINSKKGQAEIKLDLKNTDEEGEWLEKKVADDDTKNAEDLLINNELQSAIFECLDQLQLSNEQQATAFRMKTIENKDTETICKEMDITPSNLWVLIHRARKKMANCLENKWL